jgi:hypothetical protein
VVCDTEEGNIRTQTRPTRRVVFSAGPEEKEEGGVLKGQEREKDVPIPGESISGSTACSTVRIKAGVLFSARVIWASKS